MVVFTKPMDKNPAAKLKQKLHARLKKRVSPWIMAAAAVGVLISWFIIGRVALWVNPR